MIIHRTYFIITLSTIIFLFQNGCKENNSVETNNPTKKSFVFPLHVGAMWNYYFTQAGVIDPPVRGLHTWKVTGTDGSGNWNCVDIRIDSLNNGSLWRNDSVSFVIRDYPDSIKIEFPESVGLFNWSRIVPKLVDAATDTLKFSETITSGVNGWERVVYVNGIGLVEYSGKPPLMTGITQSLLLIKYSFPSAQKTRAAAPSTTK